MKENVVLLVDADGDSDGIVLEAAARTGHTVRLAKTSREAFEILKGEIRRLDIVIVDVDPGAHGLALLEAISGCAERPPIIVVTALEETYMKPITAEHGPRLAWANRSGSKRSSPRLMRRRQEVTNVNVRFADFLHAFVLHFETGGTNAIRPCNERTERTFISRTVYRPVASFPRAAAPAGIPVVAGKRASVIAERVSFSTNCLLPSFTSRNHIDARPGVENSSPLGIS